MENAEVHVERGTEQLQRASYYQVDQRHLLTSMQPFTHHLLSLLLFQQKSRRRMCILALVCSVALVLLAIIIWQVNK